MLSKPLKIVSRGRRRGDESPFYSLLRAESIPMHRNSRRLLPFKLTVRRRRLVALLVALLVTVSSICLAGESTQTASNAFPTLPEVFQGRQFATKLERDVFFLRAIRDRYPTQWPALLQANITVQDYVQAPDKLLRFVNELAIATRDRNDSVASATLARITSDKDFFANTNAYHPEILQAAAQALIAIGPDGWKALAGSFTRDHYRQDAESLEELARVVAKERPADSELSHALAATAFDFSTADGGTYPHCTAETVKDLLSLPNGAALVRDHLKTEDVVHDPARFQAVMDGIAAGQAANLSANLTAIESAVKTKLATLTNSPGAYRDDLRDLDTRLQKTIANLKGQIATQRQNTVPTP